MRASKLPLRHRRFPQVALEEDAAVEAELLQRVKPEVVEDVVVRNKRRSHRFW